MREIKFRLRDRSIQILGYEQWFETTTSGPRWLYMIEGSKYWQTKKIPHLSKDQFTGLLDKNGKEIYEGDIIELDGPMSISGYWRMRATVSFHDGSFVYKHKNWNAPDVWGSLQYNLEVIGNIHEHPHLLKEANKHG